jgi:ParB/RepB/Spo0J family partition protein
MGILATKEMSTERKFMENILLDNIIISADTLRGNPTVDADFVELIRKRGVFQPIGVRHISGSDKVELVWGHRRYLGARAAGLSTIPSIVMDLDDKEALELKLAENYMREDPNPMDAARFFERVIGDYGYKEAELGSLIDRSKSYVSNHMRVLHEPFLSELVERGRISFSVALELLGIRPDPSTHPVEYEDWKKSFGAKTTGGGRVSSKAIRRSRRGSSRDESLENAAGDEKTNSDVTHLPAREAVNSPAASELALPPESSYPSTLSLSEPIVSVKEQGVLEESCRGEERVFVTVTGNKNEILKVHEGLKIIVEALSSGRAFRSVRRKWNRPGMFSWNDER